MSERETTNNNYGPQKAQQQAQHLQQLAYSPSTTTKHQHPPITIKVPTPSYTNNIAEAKHLHNVYKMHKVKGITRSDLAYTTTTCEVMSNYLMVKTKYIQKNAILAETDWQDYVDVTCRINT